MSDRLKRIRALLDYADQQRRQISDDYGKHVDGGIPPTIQIAIKNYLENTRSILDYIAADICVYVLRLDESHRCYFPIGLRSRDDFLGFCRKNFPRLDSVRPEMCSLLESFQPFSSDAFSALQSLSKYSNWNKHRDLSAQHMVHEAHTASRFRIVRPGETIDLVSPKDFDGFLYADETRADPFLGSDYVLGNIGKVIVIDPSRLHYTAFKFCESGEDVIATLTNIQDAVEKVLICFEATLYADDEKKA
jgi:hypothetical protein